jgi:cytochrome c2
VLLPDPKFELRTYAYVKELVYDKQAKKVKAVRYVDTRSGEEFEQPAGLVIMGAYVFNNVLLMLTAGIGEPYDHTTGKGAVGRNYCYQISGNGVTVFFESKEINPFMASGAHGTNIDDFNGDNFDHSGLGFFGGAWISAGTTNGRPILTRPVPPGTPRWGRDWKRATAKWYNHAFGVGASGCNYAHRENFLDLDPTYKDALGRPLIRMSYNFRNNDYKMAQYLAGVLDRIATAMKPTIKGQRQRAAWQLQRRALSIDAQYRRHHDGGRSEDQRGQPVLPGLGRRQPVRHGGVAVSAECVLQSDRSRRRARLLVGRGDRHEVYQEPRSAGARMIDIKGRTMRHLPPGISVGVFLLLALASPATAADPDHGKALYQTCAACHTERPDALGPSLKGVVGRKSAALEDFRYSNPMKRANLVWDEANLRAYIQDPQAKVKGNRMPYGGLTDGKDVDDIVAYLKTLQ